MTKRETRAYLYTAWKADAEIKDYIEEIQRIEATATKTTTELTGMPGTTSKDPHAKIENAALRAAALRAKIDEAEAVKLEVQENIMRLKNSDYRRVLMLRHISCLRWEKIRVKMRYESLQGVTGLYDRAVRKLADIL